MVMQCVAAASSPANTVAVSTDQNGQASVPGAMTAGSVSASLTSVSDAVDVGRVDMNAPSFRRKLVTGTNLARGKTATQSSTYYTDVALVASKGNDGNKNSDNYAHTQWEPQPWWKVTFDGPVSVGTVVFYNRKDCCSERSRDLIVQVLMSGNVVESKQFNGIPTSGPDGEPFYFNGVVGNEVKITLPRKPAPDTGPLNFREVEVYEYFPTNAPTASPSDAPSDVPSLSPSDV
eukprot:CAMPEP_0196801776 /NCGR_PEP_ID=MMETSP1362-20130617/1557_1 /TAXON_ID=163516 /ORGANISM="Leptocylindrus danicus, Strain CCMP1856" /LENGTH=232 /DNA_ID=CAMNT_0042172897 /DNA_START=192 /DNA_END=886 /DNA_ORIENTATION=+